MRIAIDARLNAYRQGGIPQYTRQLLTALAEVARDDQFISLQHRDHLRPLAVAPNVARRTVLTPPHHRFEQWTLPLEVLLARPDVLHCPDFIAPLRRPCPAVVTIHDLAFMHYPEILDDAARAYYGQIKTNATRADKIIAVSEATRQDIAQYLDIPAEEIAVIYEAAAPLYGQLELRAGEARVLGATPVAAGTFMLFVSTLEVRKNLPTLLQALRICLDRRPNRPYRLVVAGARGWRDEVIFATARDLRLADHVLFVGAVGQYDLRWLYNACRIYINPSLYEGFGLPLLEAMVCGAPCLAAATSSLPEIGGDAAIYIPPLEPDLWADAIASLWDDQARRDELGRLGQARARQFSWLRAASQTLKVYQSAVERTHPAPAPAPIYTQEQSNMEEPQQTAPRALAAAVPGLSGDTRACLRCGSTLLAGPIQHGISINQTEHVDDARSLATRAWLCSRCGYIELVVEQATAPAEATDRTPNGALTSMQQLPIEEPPLVTSDGGAQDEPPAELDQPLATRVLAAIEESVAPDGEPARDDTPTAKPARSEEAPIELEQPATDTIDPATLSGIAPNPALGANGTSAAEQPAPPEPAERPAKQRQTRSKRKRTPS